MCYVEPAQTEPRPDQCPACGNVALTVWYASRGRWWCPPCQAFFEHGAAAAKAETVRVTCHLLGGIPPEAFDLPAPPATRGVRPERLDWLVDELIGAFGTDKLMALARLKLRVTAAAQLDAEQCITGGLAYESAV